MKWLLLAFFLASTAQATITATDRGTGTANTSSTSLAIQSSGTIPAGSTAIVLISMDNFSVTPNISPTSITDSVGNKWYVVQDKSTATAGASVEGAILTSVLTSDFHGTDTTPDTLTVTLSNAVTAKCWSIVQATPSAGNIALPGSYLSQANTTNSTSPLIATGGVTFNQANPSNGDLVIGAVAVESSDVFTVFDTDTTNGSWSTAQHIGVGSGATGVSISTQWKVVTAFGTQSMGTTISATNDWRGAFIILTETDPLARAAGSNGTSETTTTIPLSLPMAVGSIGVLSLSGDNANSGTANLPSSFTDSGGNTWTQRTTGIYNAGSAANSGAEIGLYTSVLTTALTPGTSTLNCGTYPVAIAIKAWTVWEFAPVAAGTMSYVTSAVGTGTTSTTPSIGTSPTSIANNDYVIGMAGAEGNNSFVGDAGTTNGTWTTKATSGSGSGLAGGCIVSQYKKVTAAATQTYAPTQSVANDTMMAWVEVNESVVGGLTAAQKAAFFQLFP